MSDLENSIPPVAAKRPFTIEKHGQQRVDPYYWLADRESAEVLDHLHKEKAYYETSTASQN